MNTALTLALAAAGLSCAAAVVAWGTVALTIWWEMSVAARRTQCSPKYSFLGKGVSGCDRKRADSRGRARAAVRSLTARQYI